MVKKITEHEFYMNYEDAIINQNQSSVIIFSAKWCSSCHNLIQTLKNKFDNNKLPILNLDIDEAETFADSMNVKSLPCILIFTNGEISYRANGITPDLLNENSKISNNYQ